MTLKSVVGEPGASCAIGRKAGSPHHTLRLLSVKHNPPARALAASIRSCTKSSPAPASFDAFRLAHPKAQAPLTAVGLTGRMIPFEGRGGALMRDPKFVEGVYKILVICETQGQSSAALVTPTAIHRHDTRRP